MGTAARQRWYGSMACRCGHESVHHDYGTDKCNYPNCNFCRKYIEQPMAMVNESPADPDDDSKKMINANATDQD